MSKHRQLVYGAPIPQDFLDALQEFIGMAHSGLQLSVVTPGTASQPANQVQVAAASGNSQVGIAINGLWRYVASPPAPISISGAPGTYDIFACTGNNSFSVNATPPPPELDATDYTFTLQALPQGSTPTSPPNYRKIGECVFDGTRILYLRQTLGGGDSYRQFQAGDLKLSAVASPPPGWLLCDGTAYSRATYGVLYAALGGSASPHGQGDGSTTFNVPDYKGRVPMGVGTAAGAAGATSHTLGAKGGEETHVLQNAEMPSHSHGGFDGYASTDHYHYGGTSNDSPDHAHNLSLSANNSPVTQSGGQGCATIGGGSSTSGATARHSHTFTTWWQSQTRNSYDGSVSDPNHRHAISADGGSGPHNTLMPYTTCNVFIKF